MSKVLIECEYDFESAGWVVSHLFVVGQHQVVQCSWGQAHDGVAGC